MSDLRPPASPPPGAPAVPHPPATAYEKTAWIMIGAGIFFFLEFRLVPALLGGLLELVRWAPAELPEHPVLLA